MKMRPWLWLLLLCLWPFVSTMVQAQSSSLPSAPVRKRLGVVIVVNGAGDNVEVSENLGYIFCEQGLPLAIHTLRWCRWSVPVLDHKDHDSRIRGARRLATYVANYHAAFPEEKIILLGHSDGTHVLLAATNLMPAQSVDRIILMASMVSYNYDLRPALSCSRGGIDHLYSKEDQIVIIAAEECGTADQKLVASAGERGFALPPQGHANALPYRNLRQYPWHPSLARTGHRGGHAGFMGVGFLEAYVVPLLLAPVNTVKE